MAEDALAHVEEDLRELWAILLTEWADASHELEAAEQEAGRFRSGPASVWFMDVESRYLRARMLCLLARQIGETLELDPPLAEEDIGGHRRIRRVDEAAVVIGGLRSALQEIAALPRPDGTYNRSRAACGQLAAAALARLENAELADAPGAGGASGG